ncbi:MAG: aspartate carbamoyltransferase catalytic subunit [Candidatus Eisenbacteria bacterium]|uniref:Aspartate carbamoyltransferase n=1 Tax=Eiseniibacteriota bacterium TaxID=2212470 RepID=A0A937XAR9_UNCEI|nr:aspartate carbamoyltransferase catalytic subunit [Candidatus Eisenbacteria bacterium]
MALQHLLGIQELSAEEILTLLDTARSFREILDRPIKKVPALRGITICNAFYESSTRTRLSFELAEKRLSADSVNFAVSGSSVSKGESLRDTIRNIEAMKVDIVVIRHWASGAAAYLARHLVARVINAGDGQHEHPTQALLDFYTIRERKGRIAGLKVAIVGDILHSRVARSNIWGLTRLGAEVCLVAPRTLLPEGIERMGVRVETDLASGLRDADVIYLLRLQLERQKGGFLPSLREYAMAYGLDRERARLAAADALIMHPGPMNRGVEIQQDVADGPQSVILEQVANGVAVRMAVLYLVSGGSPPEPVGMTPVIPAAHPAGR